jgi:hypothetical protein
VPAPLYLACACCLSLLLVTAAVASAADGAVPRPNHTWGRFGLGSWKLVHVVTETLDDQGAVASTSTTETKSTLIDADDEHYTLEIEVNVELGGKRFAAQPQIITQGYSGQLEGQSVDFQNLGASEVTIDGMRIPCEVRQVIINGGAKKRISTLYYSDRVAPFILKSDTTCNRVAEPSATCQTQVEVVSLGMPYKVLSEIKTTSLVKTVTKRDFGTSITLEVNSGEVPGGVVAHSSKEVDAIGRLLRRSTLELVDYGVVNPTELSQDGRMRLFQRIRTRRTSTR